jgi:hypothetical protein
MEKPMNNTDTYWTDLLNELTDQTDAQGTIHHKHEGDEDLITFPGVCEWMSREDDYLYFRRDANGGWTWRGIIYADADEAIAFQREGTIDIGTATTPSEVAAVLADTVSREPGIPFESPK